MNTRFSMTFIAFCTQLSMTAQGQNATEIIDVSGDGSAALVRPEGIATDASGNVYVAGRGSNNVFQITSGGVVTELANSTGDGAGNALGQPAATAVDGSGNVYAPGRSTANAFRITPGPVVTKIVDVLNPLGIASDGSDNCYVSSFSNSHVLKVTFGGTVSTIIDATGDGGGNVLSNPVGVAVDAAENVYVVGTVSDNAFKITSGGTITEILDSAGDGVNACDGPVGIAVDGAGNAYVTCEVSNNAFKITAGGVVTQIIDSTGDGMGNTLSFPRGVGVDAAGNVYVAGRQTDNVFKITQTSTITQILDATGDGGGNGLSEPYAIAVDGSGNVFVAGAASNNVFKIESDSGEAVPAASTWGWGALTLLMLIAGTLLLKKQQGATGLRTGAMSAYAWKLGLTAAALFASSPAMASPPEIATNEILIQLRPDATHGLRETSMALENAAKVGPLDVRPAYRFEFGNPALARELGLDRWYRVKVPIGTNVQETRELFDQADKVEEVWLGSVSSVTAGTTSIASTCEETPVDPCPPGGVCPDDPLFPDQINLNSYGQNQAAIDADIDAPEAWAIETGGSNTVVVAMIDGGIGLPGEPEHPDLDGRILPGETFQDTTKGIEDVSGHGTLTTGITAAAGDNGLGGAGVSWGVLILPVKVCTINEGGGLDCSYGDVAEGIIWAADNGADIMNISLRAWTGGSDPPQVLTAAVEYAAQQGVLMIAAAGNSVTPYADLPIDYPAAYPQVMAVTATTKCNELHPYSNYSTAFDQFFGIEVDVTAPGDDVVTTVNTGGFGFGCCTGAAAAQVSGVAALLKSYDPTLTADQIRSIINSTADDLGDPGQDPMFGYGRLNAHRALLAVTEKHVPAASSWGLVVMALLVAAAGTIVLRRPPRARCRSSTICI